MKKLIAALLVSVATLTFAPAPAGAETLNEVITISEQIAADLDDVSVAATALDLDALGDACVVLAVDTLVFEGYTRPRRLPRASWRHLRRGFGLFYDAAEECIIGVEDLDADAIDRATLLMDEGSVEVGLATDAL